ncbi:hypothetical protein GWK08_08620 [Leptobacterium flavescens]|uniref:Cthe-2314-like HEPN domain-containing protein n=1 Tax=Leptobacterium flavescens TaxID=472055 RepID=A0A6P0UKK8_9FLAO|nr:hypothetical protein [Leptobacterium flavescens]NER13497.1 hypothetical protein [Leptobacterium flavescens]
MKSNKKKILDIKDREEEFSKIKERIQLLNKGFRAIYADYSHHIEVRNTQLNELTNNINYRFFASLFHLELIINHHYLVEKSIEEIYSKDPEYILRRYQPVHPLYDHYEKQVTSLFDSLIFHLGSAFDYLSKVVYFIVNNKNESMSHWTKLNKISIPSNKSNFSKNPIAKTIVEENNCFVGKLYDYRSKVIHKRSDRNTYLISTVLKSGKTSAKFISSGALTNIFSGLRSKSKTHDLTVQYSSTWLINNTIDSISRILIALKSDVESKSTFPNHVKDNDIIFIQIEPGTNKGVPASTRLWNDFITHIFK